MESNNKAQKFAEVIVVEGKDDTKRLQLFFPEIETIETNGSEISDATISLIQKIATKRPIVILTDPDFNGERIRRIIGDAVPGALHAFIKRGDAVPEKSHGSLGVEHASRETLVAALSDLHAQKSVGITFTMSDMLDLGLMTGPSARKNRELVGQKLGIGYANSKQFLKRLQMFGIEPAQVKEVLAKENS